jgi:hypothetical protein
MSDKHSERLPDAAAGLLQAERRLLREKIAGGIPKGMIHYMRAGLGFASSMICLFYSSAFERDSAH